MDMINDILVIKYSLCVLVPQTQDKFIVEGNVSNHMNAWAPCCKSYVPNL